MKPVAIHPDAEAELSQALAWYENQREGLGGDFRREFERAVDRVRANPLLFAAEEGDGIRLCSMRRFPFALVYLVEEERIWLVAVADQRRRPRYWMRRLHH